MTILETERLFLEQADLNDSSFLFQLLNSPNWITHIGNRGINTLDDASRYIQNELIASYEENGFGLYKMVLKQEKYPIGLCGLLKRPDLENPDIGFALLPDYERSGYAFEAAKAIMEYAVEELNIHTIYAITKGNNERSKKLLEKLGLSFLKTIKFKGEEGLLLYSNEKSIL